MEQKQYGEFAFVAADYESMTAIKRFWYEESLKQKNRKYDFALTGSNDCLLRISIPASELFAENDTLLSNSADGVLRPFLKHIRGTEAIAHVIVATYSDNNGSDRFLKSVTEARSRNIAAWMQQQGVLPASIRSYGYGNRQPLNGNSNIRERRQNRRVTLYLVPNKNMLRIAKKGKLSEAGIQEIQKSQNQKVNFSKIWQKN